MKITIESGLQHFSEEELAEMEANARAAQDNPEEFARQMMRGVKEVVISEQVMGQLKEMGITPDELVAMLLKSGHATH